MQNYIKYAPVACLIFVVTIIVSLFAMLIDKRLYDSFILRPYNVVRGKGVYTLLTSGFIHADFTHLLFNMLSYFFFAFVLETYIGHWQFAVLYLLTLVLSDVPSVIKHRDDQQYGSLGASGAISGVIFGYIIFKPFTLIYIFFAIPIPAILYAVLYLAYCVFAANKQFNNINHSAHFWGAILGVVITIVLKPEVLSVFLQSFGGIL